MQGKEHSKQPGVLRGLSGKVLLLTIIFVMLGEILIFLPSIANFRIQWLKGRIAQAEIAALAAEAAPDQILSSDLRSEILMGAGVLVVSLQKGESRKLALRSDGDYMIDASFDLRSTMWYGAIMDAFGAMLTGENRVISVTDVPPNMSGDLIEIALYEEPLRAAMFRYGINILLLSIFLIPAGCGHDFCGAQLGAGETHAEAHPQHGGFWPESGRLFAHHKTRHAAR